VQDHILSTAGDALRSCAQKKLPFITCVHFAWEIYDPKVRVNSYGPKLMSIGVWTKSLESTFTRFTMA
jgi:hypothetical protein